MKCTKCSGHGSSPIFERLCEACGATGKIRTCPKCDGVGEIESVDTVEVVATEDVEPVIEPEPEPEPEPETEEESGPGIMGKIKSSIGL